MSAAGHAYREFDDPNELAEHLQTEHGTTTTGSPAGDVGLHRADHEVASRRAAADYEHVRLAVRGGSVTLSRCRECRALIEQSVHEQRAHDGWHEQLKGGGQPQGQDGW